MNELKNCSFLGPVMGRQYYCEYCDRSFQDNLGARKRHLASSVHIRNKKGWYDRFKDKRERLNAEIAKSRICKNYLQNGTCIFGSECRFRHMTDAEVLKLREEIESEANKNDVPTVEKWLRKYKTNAKQPRANIENDLQTTSDKELFQTTDEIRHKIPLELEGLYLPVSMLSPGPEGWLELDPVKWG